MKEQQVKHRNDGRLQNGFLSRVKPVLFQQNKPNFSLYAIIPHGAHNDNII